MTVQVGALCKFAKETFAGSKGLLLAPVSKLFVSLAKASFQSRAYKPRIPPATIMIDAITKAAISYLL